MEWDCAVGLAWLDWDWGERIGLAGLGLAGWIGIGVRG